MKNITRIIALLFLVAATVKAEPWYEAWNPWNTNPTRQEVCDYINYKLKGHFDRQYKLRAGLIKKISKGHFFHNGVDGFWG